MVGGAEEDHVVDVGGSAAGGEDDVVAVAVGGAGAASGAGAPVPVAGDEGTALGGGGVADGGAVVERLPHGADDDGVEPGLAGEVLDDGGGDDFVDAFDDPEPGPRQQVCQRDDGGDGAGGAPVGGPVPGRGKPRGEHGFEDVVAFAFPRPRVDDAFDLCPVTVDEFHLRGGAVLVGEEPGPRGRVHRIQEGRIQHGGERWGGVDDVAGDAVPFPEHPHPGAGEDVLVAGFDAVGVEGIPPRPPQVGDIVRDPGGRELHQVGFRREHVLQGRGGPGHRLAQVGEDRCRGLHPNRPVPHRRREDRVLRREHLTQQGAAGRARRCRGGCDATRALSAPGWCVR